jgi:NTP pyrophosphatase (non-canonical NTP hydrolase)
VSDAIRDSIRDEISEKLGSIDQIRDIIFGAQVREYNVRLDRLESDLTRFQRDTQDRLSQLRTTLSTDLKQSIEGLEKRIRSINSAAQADNEDLKQQIDRLTRRLASSTQELDDAIDHQNQALRSELTQTRDKFQDDLSSLCDQVLSELDRRFSSLGETKVSKEDLAETLFELGMRLKGTEVIPTLRGVADEQPLLEAAESHY